MDNDMAAGRDDLALSWAQRLRIWREDTRRWSREELVEQVVATAYQTNEPRGTEFGIRLLGRWERGEVKRPQAVYRRILAHLGAPLPMPSGGDSALVLPSHAPAASGHDGDVDRRNFLASAAAATTIVGQAQWDRLDSVLSGINRPDTAFVDSLATGTRKLFDLEEFMPAVDVIREASAHLDTITTALARGVDGSLAAKLASEAGTTAALLGWLHYDRRDFASADAYYKVAERAAIEASDSTLRACVCTYRSYLADAQGDARTSATALDVALEVLPRGEQPTMQAWISARRGETAVLLDRDAEAMRAFERAYVSFDFAQNEVTPPPWTGFFTETRLDGMAAAAYARLHNTEMETVASRMLTRFDGSAETKVQQIALADLAYSYLERGEIDQGSALAERALAAISKSRTRVGFERLTLVRDAIRPVADSQACQDLYEQLAVLGRST